ncbi:MAG: RHS repeat-associated core domain-containing protein, partial [Treponema sp.]|nr:RHS repeat-associated core domain-containing protein [Treponema sp.]
MLKALDADNNPLTVEYDRLGRRKKMTSADIGTKEWWYDKAGNVVMESDSELARKGKRINYHYDGLNRLIKIEYPFSLATEYEYGAYSATPRSDLAAGRVTKLTDESGTTVYQYGSLGQVTEETRTINLLPLSGGRSKIATMRYHSDYLGRMETIEYPDGEVVTYGYDYGGQITSVTGNRKGTIFPYVKTIGYDEYGQRIFIEYGSGVKS